MNGKRASARCKRKRAVKRKSPGFSESSGNGTPTVPIIMSNPGAAGYHRYLEEEDGGGRGTSI
jgi:hypothetical protein